MFKKSKEKASTTSTPKGKSKGLSVLGPTLSFRGGELSSDEDLIIEGVVEGTIAHQTHHLTIGKSGRVKADVRSRVITVEGTIEGDLQGDEAVFIASTAHVRGNIISPRIAVEDGASFDGNLKTTPRESAATAPAATAPAATAPAATAPAATAPTATAPAASEKSLRVTGLAGSAGVRARKQQASERAETG